MPWAASNATISTYGNLSIAFISSVVRLLHPLLRSSLLSEPVFSDLLGRGHGGNVEAEGHDQLGVEWRRRCGIQRLSAVGVWVVGRDHGRKGIVQVGARHSKRGIEEKRRGLGGLYILQASCRRICTYILIDINEAEPTERCNA